LTKKLNIELTIIEKNPSYSMLKKYCDRIDEDKMVDTLKKLDEENKANNDKNKDKEDKYSNLFKIKERLLDDMKIIANDLKIDISEIEKK